MVLILRILYDADLMTLILSIICCIMKWIIIHTAVASSLNLSLIITSDLYPRIKRRCDDTRYY